MTLERTPVFKYGPRFFRDGQSDMFEHRIDSRTLIGPRIASKIDKQNHPDLWATYLAEQAQNLDLELKAKAPKKGK